MIILFIPSFLVSLLKNMDTSGNKTSASPTENGNGKLPSLTPLMHEPWTRTGEKLKDDLNLFTTGRFYDCTFKVANDETNESKV
jgi:hypothetical protein